MTLPGRMISAVLLAVVLTACGVDQDEQAARLPNIVIIYADDLGFGDVSSYGATGVQTPHIDRLAANGVRFTDAHATAATCTPSRYSLLTGEYGFRRHAAILPGDAPALIRPGDDTLATLLKKAGYATAVVGKWHLGLGDGLVDWNREVEPGPREIGFDYSFLMPATGDRVPTAYLENQRVVDLDSNDPIEVSYAGKVGDRPTGVEHPELLRVPADRQHSDTIINGVSRIGHMAGGESALWVDEEFADVFTSKAVAFIREHQQEPFFLFHSYHDPHVPRLPHPRFAGKSDMGVRGDAIVQMDWMTGEIISELEALDIADNTLVVFTSDNGPVLWDGYYDGAAQDIGEHKPSGPFRGGKYSAFEGGTRVPTIVYWPGTVEPGLSDALISQVDIYASLAALAGIETTGGEAVDSEDVLEALLGRSNQAREELFKESMLGTMSLRRGSMKYIPPIQASQKVLDRLAEKGIESGFAPEPQLYDLSVDAGETNNIAAEHPAQVAEMQARIERLMGE